MSRASEELLARIHGLVGEAILDGLRSDDPIERAGAIKDAMRFLKDNNITAAVTTSAPLRSIAEELPSTEELEKLMSLTP